MLKAKVHSAQVLDQVGIKTLLRRADRQFPRLSHLWLDAGYRGEDKGADWVRKTLGGRWTSSSAQKSRPRRGSLGRGRGRGPRRERRWTGRG